MAVRARQTQLSLLLLAVLFSLVVADISFVDVRAKYKFQLGNLKECTQTVTVKGRGSTLADKDLIFGGSPCKGEIELWESIADSAWTAAQKTASGIMVMGHAKFPASCSGVSIRNHQMFFMRPNSNLELSVPGYERPFKFHKGVQYFWISSDAGGCVYTKAGASPPRANNSSTNEGCVAIEHLQGYVLQHRKHLMRPVLCARGFCATPNHAIIVSGRMTSMKQLCDREGGWKCTENIKLVNNLKLSSNRRARVSDEITVTPYDLRFPKLLIWVVQILEDIVYLFSVSVSTAFLLLSAIFIHSQVY